MKFVHAHRFAGMMFSAILVLILVGCGGGSSATLKSIAVTPANPTITSLTAMQQFTATGTYSDNTTKDLTSQVTWASQTTTVATITAVGLATPVANGTSNITATLGSVSGSTMLTVTLPTLTSIAVTPGNKSISLNLTQQFTATGTYSDNSTKDLTSQVTWASQTTTVATISAAGLATPVGGGNSKITATLGTVSGSTTLTVTVPTLTSIAVTPANPSVVAGLTQQFTATGTYSDTTTKDLTSQVTWASQTTTFATISTAGLAKGVAIGTSTISATLGSVSGSTLLTVTAAVLQSIRISAPPLPVTITIGGTADFTAVGVYSDGSTKTLPTSTATLSWSSGTTTTASINSTTGISIGLAVGTSTITATSGALAASTQLTVTAAASRFVYLANSNDGSISTYAVNPANATFTPIGVLPDNSATLQSGYPTQVVLEPSGRFAYVLNGFATAQTIIGVYSVNPVTGALTHITSEDTDNQGFLPVQGVTDPTGQFLYIANTNGNGALNSPTNITAYAINTVNGALTAIGSPIAANTPFQVLTDRAGKFLYVINGFDGTVNGTIDAYSINSTSGALTPLPATGLTTPPPYTTGVGAAYATIDPQNRYLYVADTGTNTIPGAVAGFTINADGSLTSMGTPFNPSASNVPFAVAEDPSGKYLYVVNSGADTIAAYLIGAGGAIPATPIGGAAVSTSPTGAPTGVFSFSVIVDPAGAFVAVVNQISNTIALFKLNSDGSLTPTSTVATRVSPYFASIYAAPASPTVAPAAVFATNSTAGTISEYTVTPATGVLTPTAGPFMDRSGDFFATTDITGQYLYVTNGSKNEISAFNVTQSSAALADLSGSPYSLGTAVPTSAVAEPSDRFVYVAGSGASGSILGFNLDTTTNSLNPFATPTAVSNLNVIVGDPQGLALYPCL
jgi:6-phosphogluconolactonase (cycloisomerase 2 family)